MTDGGEPKGTLTLPRWALPVAGAVLLGLVAAVVVLFVRGGDDAADAPPAAAAPAGPSPEYVTAVERPVRRLTQSAQVSGRVLARASGADDVAAVGRMATQQIAVVEEARATIADIQGGPGERAATGSLSRATQAHRTYLASLVRLPDADPSSARGRITNIRGQAKRALANYRAFLAEVPGVPRGITAAGLADVTGLTEALSAREREAQEAAAAAEDEGPSGDGGDAGGSGGPVVSRVATTDRGSFVEISATYCDRTPGTVNDFVYTFRVVSGGTVLAEDAYSLSQTRACNDLYMTFDDTFAIGTYEAQVLVENLTNRVSGSAVGSLNVIN